MHLLLVFFLLLFNCSDNNRLKDYLNNIPEKEEINASLYHYELIAEDARQAFSNQEYDQVLNLYEKYLQVFFEASVPREESLLYWVGRSVEEIIGEGLNTHSAEGEKFFSYLKENKIRKSYFGIEFEKNHTSNKGEDGKNQPEKIFYQGKHFAMIINQRGDYEWEKLALRRIYAQKFLSPKNLPENFNHGYWLVTRYPDLFPPTEYRSLLYQHINTQQLSHKNQKRWDRLQEILWVNEWAVKGEKSSSIVCFPISGPVVVYNRTDWISSRNLASLALWEPFYVIAEGPGENGKTWYAVTFKGDRRGFVDQENFSEACSSKWNIALSESLEKYLVAYQQFLDQDYFTAIETLSTLLYQLERLPDDKTRLLEKAWVLFYQVLREIAQRSTSLNSPYTQFAQEYDQYFEVSQNQINLEVTDFFLKKIIVYDQNSSMLQYFQGFN